MGHRRQAQITMRAMGLEAECTVTVGRKTAAGTAHLQGERLLFRGDVRLDIPFESMRDVRVEGDALVVETPDQQVRFALGAPVAERWMRLVKEPKSLFEKLEVGPQSRVAVVDVNDSLFLTALRERAASVAEGRVPEGVPIIFFGAETRDALRKLPLLRARMVDAGVLWVVRPRASKAVSAADVLEAVRGAGLADAKVVAFSKTHVAHKCVIPVEMRGQATRPRPPIVSIPPSAPAVAAKRGGAKPATAPARAEGKRAARKAAKKKAAAKPRKRR
jgi:hypothetical protein